MPRRLQPGDVLLSSEAPLGCVAVLRAEDGRLCLGQRLFALRGAQEVLDGDYLAAALTVDPVRSRLIARATGTTVSGIKQAELRKVLLPIPPIAEQRAIASVLGALDDKIESDKRLASAARAVLMATIPADGVQRPLASVAAFLNGGALTKHATRDGLPILRIKELKAGVTADTPRTSVPVKPQHEVTHGDLLFSWSGTLLAHRWTGGPAVLNQHVFRVDPCEPYPRWLVEAWVEEHLPEFRRIAADKATTMGHIQRHHLSGAEVVVPSDPDLAVLRTRFDRVDDLRITALTEAHTLNALRDALLPKLVSGQIRVPLSDDSAEPLGAALEAHELQEARAQ